MPAVASTSPHTQGLALLDVPKGYNDGMSRKIGVYPGTFDPIHRGHVGFALQAMQTLGLDEVAFLPEPKPRHKTHVTGISHRTALISAIATETRGLKVVNLVSERFTVHDTLPEIRRIFGDAELTLLIGSDVVKSLDRWQGLDTLLQEVVLAVGIRVGDDEASIEACLESLIRSRGVPVRYSLISAPGAEITSSQVRSGAASPSQVHPLVTRYIRQHQLYDLGPADA